MQTIIRVEKLAKTFNQHQALHAVDLNIHHGEMVALLGPSGSGKSTLLRHLSGLITGDKSAGSHIELLGRTVQREGRLARDIRKSRANTGYIFQQFNLVNRLSVLENVLIGALGSTPFWRTCLRWFTPSQKQEALQALTRVGMAHFAHQRVSTLSGGQQQRVAIARALVNEPKVLLLDEPLGALDAKLRKEMQFELKKIQKEVGITFIFVTHDQEEALSMSDTVVVMNNGIIQQIGSPEDIYNEPENRFVANFIGDSNIIEGNMIRDCLVCFDGIEFPCVDKGFKDNEEVEVVLRPEDIDIVEPDKSKLKGKVASIVFKGVHYEIIVRTDRRDYKIHTTDYHEVGKAVGLSFTDEDIHVMYTMEN